MFKKLTKSIPDTEGLKKVHWICSYGNDPNEISAEIQDTKKLYDFLLESGYDQVMKALKYKIEVMELELRKQTPQHTT